MGGLTLQDLSSKIASLKFKWIVTIIGINVDKPWKAYLACKFIEPIESLPMYNLSMHDINNITDDFYKSVFKMWTNLHNEEPEKTSEVLKQVIWKNSYIRISGVPVYYKNWADHQIIHLRDLLDDHGEI